MYDEKPTHTRKQYASTEDISTKSLSIYERLNYRLEHDVDIENKIVYITGEITEETPKRVQLGFRACMEYHGEDMDSITLIINSTGGDVNAALAIIDLMHNLTTKVNTLCRGIAYSAAAVILSAGTGIRMCGKYASIMYHEASLEVEPIKMRDAMSYMQEMTRLEEMIYALLSSKSSLSIDEWRRICSLDSYIEPERLLESKAIDQIV